MRSEETSERENLSSAENRCTTGDLWPLSCPVPFSSQSTIQLAHGGGGRLMQQLIREVFLPLMTGDPLAVGSLPPLHDSATVELGQVRVAFTTDSYVVRPLFFPGGDIGRLAVCGTVNDLAMAGARPLALAAAFILEEGFPLEDLRRILLSMQEAAKSSKVAFVTGDTKVVDRGKGDGVFITTTGLGLIREGVEIGPRQVRAGDAIVISGDLGRHGIAILSVREGLQFESPVESDCCPLFPQVDGLLAAGIKVHCLRDLTRGGLASALNEIAADARVGMELQEDAIPVSEPVAGACELLGLDPIYVACEGRLVAIVAEKDAQKTCEILRRFPGGEAAAVVGRCVAEHPGVVIARGPWGTDRVIDLLSGEQMPRIC